jgi:hypothetical protein
VKTERVTQLRLRRRQRKVDFVSEHKERDALEHIRREQGLYARRKEVASSMLFLNKK